MDQILAKLVNLSYELLGVFLPGFIFSLFILLVWWCTGDLISVITTGGIPALTVNWLEGFIQKLDVRLGVGLAVPAILASYFLGNLLVWISRSGRPDSNANSWHLLRSSLFLKIPKPEHSYAVALGPLFDRVREKFTAPGVASLEWRMFYPVGKAYLARNVANSLVTTYQNKYTFHRSLVLGAVVVFWLSAFALITAAVTNHFVHVVPRWYQLIGLAAFSLFMVNGFTASYRLHWGLFGDTIITELYSLFFGPERKSNESK